MSRATNTRITSKKRAKVISRTEAGRIIRLRDGHFRIDCIDPDGKRRRPAFATREEASAALAALAGRKPKGEFFARMTDLETRVTALEAKLERVAS